ncbi:hypothetical protein IPH25_04830 [bacterium]|nr:MAG: hypothetical protein IPG37_01835 [bacterium]QQR61763.1 MAG: hypothetical protein IPH25_04830 [bacterium]
MNYTEMNRNSTAFVCGAIIVLICILLGSFRRGMHLDIARTEAIKQAGLLDQKHNNYDFLTFTFPNSDLLPNDLTHRFVWQKHRQQYDQLTADGYVQAPHWVVRKATFEGDVATRGSESHIHLKNDGSLHHKQYIVPQNLAGKSLSEMDAEKIVYAALLKECGFEKTDVTKLSAVPSQQPARIDWQFDFQVLKGTQLSEGQLRVVVLIAGEEVTLVRKYIHVPEDWQRAEFAKISMVSLLKSLAFFLWLLLILLCSFFAGGGIRLHEMPIRKILLLACILLCIAVINAVNLWPFVFASFSTAVDWHIQLATSVPMQMIGLLVTVLPLVFTFFILIKNRFSEDNGRLAYHERLFAFLAGSFVGLLFFVVRHLLMIVLPAFDTFIQHDTFLYANAYIPQFLLVGLSIIGLFRYAVSAFMFKYMFDWIGKFNIFLQLFCGIFVCMFIVLGWSTTEFEYIPTFVSLFLISLAIIVNGKKPHLLLAPHMFGTQYFFAYVAGVYGLLFCFIPMLKNHFPGAWIGYLVGLIMVLLIGLLFPIEREAAN